MTAARSSSRALILGLALGTGLAGFAALPAGAQDEDDKPYSIAEDGTADWATFSGFRRYHAECHVCHGPDGLGSSFAPALAETMKDYGYDDYLEIVVNGRENLGAGKENVMPAFGENKNVMCYIDDIYAYLRARADGALGRGRPKHSGKTEEAKEHEAACMG